MRIHIRYGWHFDSRAERLQDTAASGTAGNQPPHRTRNAASHRVRRLYSSTSRSGLAAPRSRFPPRAAPCLLSGVTGRLLHSRRHGLRICTVGPLQPLQCVRQLVGKGGRGALVAGRGCTPTVPASFAAIGRFEMYVGLYISYNSSHLIKFPLHSSITPIITHRDPASRFSSPPQKSAAAAAAGRAQLQSTNLWFGAPC
jgi:hypothetical protein